MKIGDYDLSLRYGQNNLSELCAPMDRDHSAGFRNNSAFGITTILKRYAGFPEDYPVRFAIEHGLKFNEGGILPNAVKHFRTILVPSHERAETLARLTDKSAEAIGFGFLYAKHLYDEEFGSTPPNSERKGTLFMPLKSTRRTTIDVDHAAYAKILLSLPQRFQPVAVCVFWLDYQRDVHRAYEEAGLPLVTAGHRHHPDFLLRMYDLMRQFRYAASNEIGTNLCISIAAGCRFFYVRGPEYTRIVDEDKTSTDERSGDAYEINRAKSQRLFPKPVDEHTPEQLAFVDRFIGTPSFKSRQELRNIMLKAHRSQESRPFWHGFNKLTSPPDAKNYDFSIAAPGDGWHFTENDKERHFRWMGLREDAWIDLSWNMTGPAILNCHIHSCISSDVANGLEISVNDQAVTDLKLTPDEPGFKVEGKFDALTSGIIRIRFSVPEVICPCDIYPDNPETRSLGIAVSNISISSAKL